MEDPTEADAVVESPSEGLPEEEATEEQANSSEYVILAYNVPEAYTVSMMEELIAKTLPNVKKPTVMVPPPWEDRSCYPLRITCSNVETYDAILAKQDIWVKSDVMNQASQAITFMAGDMMDIPHVPFKSDAMLLMKEHSEQDVASQV
ncbi:hypothetical protein BgAZ_306040 [Babesia gibsoni]|uniref:Uncharacterized protein n=1 Tax=Babesia gibsoni TaxID=33632 RepID=A0AAD8PE26_BABGI|nr:hypothetical protein BgAZ_306040 [Babesia gibsoni]